ncbi:uncharacterized protein LOC143497847 isoform X3 [Brachyhypopomus gauderio]
MAAEKWRHKPTSLVVYSDSLATLDDNQWIDDVILELEFRNIYSSLRPPLQRKTYFFPVLFGNKLERSSQGDYNEAISWVKAGRIFSREYLFMCQHVNGNHWRLLIICFPGLDPLETKKQGKARPCILILDSLQRSGGNETICNIRGFLSAAWEQTHKTPRSFASLPAISVTVPQQSGSTECGIFVILFARRFLEDLPIDVSKDIIDKSHWFTMEDAKTARKELKENILSSCEVCAVENNERQKDHDKTEEVRNNEEDKIAMKRKNRSSNQIKRESEWKVCPKEKKNDNREGKQKKSEDKTGEKGTIRNLGQENEIIECKECEKQEKTHGVGCGEKENVVDLLEALVKEDESLEGYGKEEESTGQGEWSQKKQGIESKGKVYNVLGRLTVTGKHYCVDEEEIKRRVKGENMSANVLRSLIRVGKRDIPREVLAQPKKAKTQVSMFSALTEGEAQDLALGYGSSLTKYFPKAQLIQGIPPDDAAVTM